MGKGVGARIGDFVCLDRKEGVKLGGRNRVGYIYRVLMNLKS